MAPIVDGMQIDVMAGVLLLGSAGASAGIAARWLLGRMRRGTQVRAPLCAAAVGAVWATVGGGWGAGLLPDRWVPALLGSGWLGITAGVVDLRHRRLPDALTLPALCLAPVLLLPLGVAAVERGLVAGLAGIAAYGGLHLVAPTAMGAGDVKLAGSLATVLGAASWSALVLAAGLAAVLTAALGLGALVFAKVGLGGVPRSRAPRLQEGPALQEGTAQGRAGFSGWPGGPVSPRYGSMVPRQRARASPVPHGPSMLAATWLVTFIAATGAGAG